MKIKKRREANKVQPSIANKNCQRHITLVAVDKL